MNRAKIRLLVGNAQADRFLADPVHGGQAEGDSLHDAFVDAHQAVVELSEGKSPMQRAEAAVEHLNRACSAFMEELTNEFLRRASSLELLHVPDTSPDRREGNKGAP
jgi:hypothetical protein